ncbi:hypothetical protein ACH5A2_19800 [Streptomyces collinus]|uniref:hypothetical protein n=1 Tax=Streptomyces collinus TaxID=42684 RepID=UPI0037A61379
MTTGNEPTGATPRGGPPQTDAERFRDGRHRYARSPETVALDARAADLRAQGATYQQIADELGYRSRSGAIDAVRRAVRDACAGPAQALIDLEVTRLEMITDEVLEILQRDHVVVSHGKVVKDEEGKPLLDDGVKLQAVDRYLRSRESFRKLLGLDKPAKVEHSGGVRYEVIGVDPADLT